MDVQLVVIRMRGTDSTRCRPPRRRRCPKPLAGVLSIATAVVLATGAVARAQGKGVDYYTDGVQLGEDKIRLEVLFNDAAQLAGKDADGALEKLKEARKLDPKNANIYYLAAAAYAKKGQWPQMTNALKRGNTLPCYVYVNYTGWKMMQMKLAHLARMRDIARQAKNGGGDALLAARQMGLRQMQARPETLISLLVGIAVVAITDKDLVEYYQSKKNTKGVEFWTRQRDADSRWSESTKAKTKQFAGQLSGAFEGTGVSEKVLQDPAAAGAMTDEQERKLDEVADKMRQAEAQLVKSLLATRPK